jgi:nucleoside-diphosphate-sugar epimerase
MNITNENFNPTILRLGTVFGKSHRQRFDLVVNTFSKSAHINKELNVFGGDQWRPNIHVSDVNKCIIHLIKDRSGKSFNKIFNLSNNNLNMKINDLAKKVSKVFKNSKLKIDKRLTDKRNYRVSSKKLKDEMGFVAKIDLETGINELKDFFNKNKNKNFDNKIYSNFETLKDEYK